LSLLLQLADRQATIYTTPWDNVAYIYFIAGLADKQFIIARGGWTYPVGSVIGTIHYIPIEEHLFFILQPIFIVLLHSVLTHSTLLPFRIPQSTHNRLTVQKEEEEVSTKHEKRVLVRTLRRKPLDASVWAVVFLAGLYLVNDAHEVFPDLIWREFSFGMKGFYLGWILVWISPVLGWLTYLGADMYGADWKTFILGGGWLCVVDTSVNS
jgi:15-cis-phytoene synthase/lycopene beta-cyclase